MSLHESKWLLYLPTAASHTISWSLCTSCIFNMRKTLWHYFILTDSVARKKCYIICVWNCIQADRIVSVASYTYPTIISYTAITIQVITVAARFLKNNTTKAKTMAYNDECTDALADDGSASCSRIPAEKLKCNIQQSPNKPVIQCKSHVSTKTLALQSAAKTIQFQNQTLTWWVFNSENYPDKVKTSLDL